MPRLTTEQMTESVDVVRKTVESTFAQLGEWPPTAFLSSRLGPDGNEYAVPAQIVVQLGDVFAEEGGKDKAAAFLRALVRKSKAAQVVLAIEAWTLDSRETKATAEELAAEVDAHGGVSHHPLRQEAVFVTVFREDGAQEAWIARINREGGVAKLGEWESSDATISGRFGNFFPPHAEA